MAAYIVTLKMQDELINCEMFSGYKAASEAAINMCSFLCDGNTSKLVNKTPDENLMKDQSVRWDFVKSPEISIQVWFKQMRRQTNSKSVHSFENEPNFIKYGDKTDKPAESNSMNCIPNIYEDKAPGGYTLALKPLMIADVKSNPYNTHLYSTLEYKYQRALTIAIIQNTDSNLSTDVREHAIKAIKNDTVWGRAIVDLEMKQLANILENYKREYDRKHISFY